MAATTTDPASTIQRSGGQPIRRAIQQDERPDAGGRRHGRQHDPRHQEFPASPQLGHRNSDQRRDRGRQRHRVIRVHRAVHEAEHGARHQQPAAPEQQSGTDASGARRAPGEPDARRKSDERNGQQPGRLDTHRLSEESADARLRRRRTGWRLRDRRRPVRRRGRPRHRRCARSRCSPTPAAADCCRWSRRCTDASRPATG